MKKGMHNGIVVLIVAASIFISSSGGRNDRWSGAPGDNGNCTACHGTNSTSSAVLTGAPAVITLGQTYSLTLTVSDPSPTSLAAGFQIGVSSGAALPVSAGTFTASAGTRVNPGGRLVHSAPQNYVNDETSWTFDWTAPTINDYSELTFFYSTNSANLNGNTGGDNGFFDNSANITVPVEWAYFTVSRNDGYDELLWGTHMEDMTDYFEVEYSVDGRDFQSIGKVDAAIYSSTEEHYSITNRAVRGDAYYRIKQIDLNGHSSFSEIKAVQGSAVNLHVYPTTVADFIRVEGVVIDGTAEVINMQGQVVMSSPLQDVLQVDQLMAGTYILRLESEAGMFLLAQKFVKL